MNILHSYKNNNYTINLYSDGTKVREYTETPVPLNPESADIKITNYCDLGCVYCHESSTEEGKHADLEVALNFLDSLPSGTELALGGGNPLSHPNLNEFLLGLKRKELIANITINQLHLEPYKSHILDIIRNKLIYGVGVSYNKNKLGCVEWLMDETDNLVFHMIIGVHTLDDLQRLYDLASSKNKSLKVLLLGYKQYGFGKDLYGKKSEAIDSKIISWYQRLPIFFKKENLYLSFDNLAIRQLNLKRFFVDGEWEKFYMGDDARFTFYIDFVSQCFAKSSTGIERHKIEGLNATQAFQLIKI